MRKENRSVAPADAKHETLLTECTSAEQNFSLETGENSFIFMDYILWKRADCRRFFGVSFDVFPRPRPT